MQCKAAKNWKYSVHLLRLEIISSIIAGYLCVHVKLGEMIIWRMDMEKDSLDKEEILYKQLAVDDSEILVANFADK